MNEELYQWLIKLRRQIHEYPEPAFKEYRTSEVILKALDQLGIQGRRIAETGVIAELGASRKPVVALRADMDALSVEEKTGLPFSSKHRGLMHACGHDGHMAIAVGTAALLKEDPPPGRVIFIFQPAEEGGGGAKRIIEEGGLKDVDMIFGGHIDLHFRTGTVAIRRYTDTAYTDALEIEIIGRGGHAARPHETVDAIVVGSLFVSALQSIVSRTVDPLNPTVISIGTFQAGTVYNAIADRAHLTGTIRCTDEETRKIVHEKIRKMASSFGSIYDAHIDVKIHDGYPPVINHPDAFMLARGVAERIRGEENFIQLYLPSLGGEDFSFYLQRVPGAFVRFGALNERHEFQPPHSSLFDFDEEVIRVGAIYFSELIREAIRFLGK